MTNKVDMKVGDIISIAKKKKPHVVISCGLYESKAYDGSYWVYQFSTVELPEHYGLSKILDSSLYQSNPKQHDFYLDGYSMSGTGKKLNVSDVKIIGSCKTTKEVSVRYEFKKVRFI